MSFKKPMFHLERVLFYGKKILDVVPGHKAPNFLGKVINLPIGVRLAQGFDKPAFCIFSPINSAITVGLKAAGGITVAGAYTLSVAGGDRVTTGFTQPDVPRTIRVVSNHAGMGTNTYAGATVLIEGLNSYGETIKENIPLNGTGAKNSIRAFSKVNAITYPARDSSGATITVTVGGALGLPHKVDGAAKLMMISRKASAAVGWTQETLPATTDLGSAYGPINQGLKTTDLTFTITDTKLVGTFPAAPFIGEFMDADGITEHVTITVISDDATTTTFTMVRGLHGETAQVHSQGVNFAWRPGNTITPAITTDDRLGLVYFTQEL